MAAAGLDAPRTLVRMDFLEQQLVTVVSPAYLRAYLARANEALDRGLADDAYESFSAALRLFDVRELTPPRADVRLPAVDAPGLLPLAQRIDAAFRRRGAHEQVVTALLVQMTLAPADAGPRARLIELARWLSGEPTTTTPVPSDRILVPIGGGGSEPVPKGEDESKRGSGRSARKAARARPKGEDAAPASTAAFKCSASSSVRSAHRPRTIPRSGTPSVTVAVTSLVVRHRPKLRSSSQRVTSTAWTWIFPRRFSSGRVTQNVPETMPWTDTSRQ